MAILRSSKINAKKHREVEVDQGNVSVSRNATMGFRLNMWGNERHYGLDLSRGEAEEIRNVLDKWLSPTTHK
jgi:uncharacterized membrane protein